MLLLMKMTNRCVCDSHVSIADDITATQLSDRLGPGQVLADTHVGNYKLCVSTAMTWDTSPVPALLTQVRSPVRFITTVKEAVHSLEWVSLIRLLDGLQDALVYPEADGDGEQSQADVGADAHDAAHGQREQQQQGGAEHHTCALHITPVEELHH